jgi:arylsulfatase A
MNRIRNMKINWMPSLCVALALSAGGLAAAPVQPGASPNIIFILTDDQGWADLNTPMDPAVPEGTCAYFHTPNMDRLAAEGMRFPSGYAPASLCTPTRRSIQFGMTPARQRGTEFVGDFSPQGHLSIPQALKRANPLYRCAHFGKWGETMSGPWHRSDQQDPNMEASPTRLGYDENDGLTGNTTGTQDAIIDKVNGRKRDNMLTPDADPKRTFSVTGRAISFMERQVQEKRPFYLQVSYYAIHLALQAREATIAKYAGKGELPRQVKAGVAPMLEDLDDGIGQLLAAIEKLGIRGNTYVFFSSDNGGEPEAAAPERRTLPPRNHPLMKVKGWLYEGGIRVPFMVRGPGVQAGAVCREPVVQYDLLPTFYDLAGGREPLPTEIDGGSLRPLLADPLGGAVKRALPGLVFHQPCRNKLEYSVLRVGDYKLVLKWSGPWQVKSRELFNLAKDIGEQKNLADQMPEKTDEMAATLIAYLKSVNAETAAVPKPGKPVKKPVAQKAKP